MQDLVDAPPAERQRTLARRMGGLPRLVETLSAQFTG
jgi:hypothetical protein